LKDHYKLGIKQVYEKEAELYISKRPFMKSHILQRILKLLSHFLKDNTIVLNIGCGSGYLEKSISAGSKAFYVALDISREMTRMTKNLAPQVEVVVADAEALPFRQDIFDLVICSRAIKFLNYPKLFRSLKDVLKEKSFFTIIFDSGDALWIRLLERLGKHVDHVGRTRGMMLKTRDLELGQKSLDFEILRTIPITFMPLSIFEYIPARLRWLVEFFDKPKKRGRITFMACRFKESD